MKSTLCCLVSCLALFLVSFPQRTSADPLAEALAKVGLDKAAATFDRDLMPSFGGAEFELPLFRAFHSSPHKAPSYASTLAATVREKANSLHQLVTFGTFALSDSVRRGWVDDPLQPLAQKAAEPEALANAIIELCQNSASPVSPEREAALRQAASALPPALAQQAAFLVHSSAQALHWREMALAKANESLDLPSIFSKFPSNLSREDFDPDLYALMHSVDLKFLFSGAEDLAQAVDRASSALKTLPLEKNLSFQWDTPLGRISIGTPQNDRYAGGEAYLLIIDPAGNDVYEGGGATISYNNPISVLIDLQGNDTYRNETEQAAFGAGMLGYGFLVDLEGKDTYQTRSFGLGSASFGAAGLLDSSGDDVYGGRSLCQGAATFGIAFLSDLRGNDTYETFTQSQGFAYAKGLGLLVDLEGDDRYLANDTQIDFPSYQTAEHNSSLSQGMGFGRRADISDGHSLAGGIGLLYDAEGDDSYSAGLFAQGAGYWYGLGMLVDEAGDDAYQGVWYVQASAAHFAAGVLLDKAGNDHYRATSNMAIGAGHDFSLGFLLDQAGNDLYQAPNLSLGGANANGIGIFWDIAGNDTYEVSAGMTFGRGNHASRGTLRDGLISLGVFLDTAGDDFYPPGYPFAGNNTTWTQSGPDAEHPLDTEKGVGLDRNED